jgi:hypothetical protein
VESERKVLCGRVTFDLLALPRLIPLRRFRTVPTVQLLAFERIDMAERAGVSKVEFDDIVAVVEWCARVWPQGRFLVEGHEGMRRRRRTDARSGYSGGGGRGGSVSRGGRRYDWSGRERCCSTARCIVRPR